VLPAENKAKGGGVFWRFAEVGPGGGIGTQSRRYVGIEPVTGGSRCERGGDANDDGMLSTS
jgi:hypothetical protein